MLKKFQVVEKENDKWSVVELHTTISRGLESIGKFECGTVEFNTAAEAQELADELNEEHGYELDDYE